MAPNMNENFTESMKEKIWYLFVNYTLNNREIFERMCAEDETFLSFFTARGVQKFLCRTRE